MGLSKQALLVMSSARATPLLKQLRWCNLQVKWVTTREAARQLFEAGERVQLVLTDTALPDGDWRGVLEDLAASGVQAELIVCSRDADRHFHCEVVQNGAYDMLSEPYDVHLVQRLMDAAAARAEMRRLAA